MADTPVVSIENNGYRNASIRVTLVSDGSGFSGVKIFDATSSGSFGVTAPGGQVVYPGLHTSIMALDYDCQDMQLRLQWEGSPANQDIAVLGSQSQDFDWTQIGGLRVPQALAGVTGSILITSLAPQVNSSFWLVMRLRKNVPVS